MKADSIHRVCIELLVYFNTLARQHQSIGGFRLLGVALGVMNRSTARACAMLSISTTYARELCSRTMIAF